MEKNKGITLIALVITIIVLLILAGVTIATLTGDNGLLQKATTAKEENEQAKELELLKLAVSAAQVAGEGTITKDGLESELRADFNDNTITVGEIKDGWIFKGYKINESGEVDKLLPDEYQQVEYLESTGTQYINTKLSMPNGFHAVFNVMPTKQQSSFIFGAEDPNPFNRNYIKIYQNNLYWEIGNYGFSRIRSDIQTNVKYDIDVCNIHNYISLIVNGEKK